MRTYPWPVDERAKLLLACGFAPDEGQHDLLGALIAVSAKQPPHDSDRVENRVVGFTAECQECPYRQCDRRQRARAFGARIANLQHGHTVAATCGRLANLRRLSHACFPAAIVPPAAPPASARPTGTLRSPRAAAPPRCPGGRGAGRPRRQAP